MTKVNSFDALLLNQLRTLLKGYMHYIFEHQQTSRLGIKLYEKEFLATIHDVLCCQMEKKTEQQLITQRTLEDKRRELLTLESKLQVLQEQIQNSTSATAQQSQLENNLKVSNPTWQSGIIVPIKT